MTWPEEQYLPFKLGCHRKWLYTIYSRSWWCLKVCMSHVFPSLRLLACVFFCSPVFDTFPSESKSFGAALIFVWSLQSQFLLSFPKENSFFYSSCKTFFLQQLTTSRKGRNMQIVPIQKKIVSSERAKELLVMRCFFFLLLIMEQNTEIPFAKAISAAQRQRSVFRSTSSCFLYRHHVKTFRVFSNFPLFSVVVVVDCFCTRELNLLHIALHLEIGIEFSSYLRFTDGKREWIKLKPRDFVSIRSAKVTFN